MASSSASQQIDVSKLALPQLAQLKQQLEQELGVFQESIQTLKIALNKFSESGDLLMKISPDSEGKSILVPLTGSMYVPGTLTDVDKVLIDIGTGYYAQKDIESGKDYFKRKVQFVNEQIEKINLLGMEKSKFHEAITMVMEMKVQQQLQAQKAGAS